LHSNHTMLSIPITVCTHNNFIWNRNIAKFHGNRTDGYIFIDKEHELFVQPSYVILYYDQINYLQDSCMCLPAITAFSVIFFLSKLGIVLQFFTNSNAFFWGPSQYDWNDVKETLNPSTNKQTNMLRLTPHSDPLLEKCTFITENYIMNIIIWEKKLSDIFCLVLPLSRDFFIIIRCTTM